ncbi:MAG: GntR family transcriptional regulator [Marinobacter sp.]|nr:GntR family transcriptional regulator [Marinobacter sp.]
MSKQADSATSTNRAFKKRTGSKSDTIYAHIFDAILEHRLSPGTKLSEEALGEIFGVSRTIIRRELLQLAHEGVVSIRPNRGAMVANPSVEEARQILYARRLVERTITELVVQNATEKQLAELRKMVVDEQNCFTRGEMGTGIRLSGEFHLKLAEVAGNAPLTGFQRSLVSQTSLIIAQYEKVTRSHCSFDEHNQLLDAVAAKDTEKAISLMMRHMDHIDEKLNFDDEGATDDLHAIFSHVRG